MFPAYSIVEVRRELARAFSYRYPDAINNHVRMVGLLFAPPGSRIAQSEILPRINDFHHRSSNNIDFFCAGYGAFWPEGWIEDEEVVVSITEPPFGHKTDWLYSAKLFNDFLNEVKEATRNKWNYSEEVDLILLNAYHDTKEEARLDFSRGIVLNLQKMKDDKCITSTMDLFSLIFQYVEKQDGSDPTWGFSDLMGIKEGKSWFIDLILSLSPAKIGKLWKSGKHYAVLDFN